MIYLDYNATTPVDKRVALAMEEALLEKWGNPSSGHPLGAKAKDALERARGSVSSLINADPEEIVFTSGGTESNNLVILGLAAHFRSQKKHLITSKIEHPSVMNPCLHLLEQGWKVSFVSVDRQGIVKLDELEEAVTDQTFLVTIMLANNETGALQPIKEIASMCARRGVLLHSDAAQAVGKISVDVQKLGVNYLTVAGHKFYAPKGIGALFIKQGSPFGNIMFGAGQEHGKRPGTEPVPGAVALGAAAELAASDLPVEEKRQRSLRERLFEGIKAVYPKVVRHGRPDKTLPNTLSIAFPGIMASELLSKMKNLCASTGAACHDRSVAVSHVLAAMGVNQDVALGTIRLSLGRYTTQAHIDEAVHLFEAALGSS